jgi:hypothetical protein
MKTGNIIITRKNALAATPDNTLSFKGTVAAIIIRPRTYRIAASTFFFIAGLKFVTCASRIPDIQHKLHPSDGGLGGVLLPARTGTYLCRKDFIHSSLLAGSLKKEQ